MPYLQLKFSVIISWYYHKKQTPVSFETRVLVGRVGVEPTRYKYRRILSPLRLPIPPSPQAVREQFYLKRV